MADNFLNDVPQTTSVGTMTNSQTTMTVNSSAGFPTAPFTAALGLDANGHFTTSTEAIHVTAVAGTVWTIARGYDSTPAVSHPSGETVTHVVLAQLANQAAAHLAASTAVHGITGAVVGTTDTQTLTSKSLTSPTVTGTLAGAASTWSSTVGVTGLLTCVTLTLTGALNTSSTITTTSTSTSAVSAASGTVTAKQVTATNNIKLPIFTTEAARDAAITAPTAGMACFLTAPTVAPSACAEVYDGTTWNPTPIIQHGSCTWTFSASPTSAALVVTFPVAFPVAPDVVITSFSVTGNTVFSASLNAITTTNFTTICRNDAGGNYTGTLTGRWVAVL